VFGLYTTIEIRHEIRNPQHARLYTNQHVNARSAAPTDTAPTRAAGDAARRLLFRATRHLRAPRLVKNMRLAMALHTAHTKGVVAGHDGGDDARPGRIPCCAGRKA